MVACQTVTDSSLPFSPLKQLVSYILRCSCHERQPSRIRDLLHHAICVALYPIQHKHHTLIQPKFTVPQSRVTKKQQQTMRDSIIGARRLCARRLYNDKHVQLSKSKGVIHSILHMCSQAHVGKYATLHNHDITDFGAATASATAYSAISIFTLPSIPCMAHLLPAFLALCCGTFRVAANSPNL
eukprot:jgi/Chrzof1/5964/Cz16g21340.t1